jgi:hypothetical protein
MGIRRLGLPGRLLLGVAVGGVVFGIATAVQASIPDVQGVIHACYLKSGGTVNVIDNSTSSCTSKQTALNWNQKGITGARGPTGRGATGPTGAKGGDGTNGTPGQRGPTGLNGVNGSNGQNGLNGVNGSNGQRGPSGPTGAKGPTGKAGINGTDGKDGAKGPSGGRGPTGPTGSAGAISTYASSASFDISPLTQGNKTVSCKSGDQVTGGGVDVGLNDAIPAVSVPSGQGWYANVYNPAAFQTITATVYVVCLKLG